MVGIDLEAAREKDSRRNVAALTLRKRGSLFRMEEWSRSLALCQAFQGLSVLRRMPGLRPAPRRSGMRAPVPAVEEGPASGQKRIEGVITAFREVSISEGRLAKADSVVGL